MHAHRLGRARALAAALLLGAAGGCGASGAELAVGTAGPWKEGYAQMVRRAVELAVQEANDAGGVGGRRVAVVARDDQGDGVKAAEIAQEFLADARVVGVVGHANSGGMVGAAPMYDHGLAAIAPSATSPEITGISPWVFRVTTNDSVNGVRLAGFADGLRARRAVVLYENNVYGRDLAAAFRAHYHGTLVGMDPIPGDGSGVEPFVSYYKRVAPDLVFVAGTEASGRALLREAARQDFRTTWVAGDGWTGLQGEASAEGAYVAVPFRVDDPRPEARRFVEAFRARYGVTPDANAAMAYDATRLLLRAAAEAGSDRRAVRDWLAGVRQGGHAFTGATGEIRFRPDGDPEGARFAMTRVAGGELRAVEVAP